MIATEQEWLHFLDNKPQWIGPQGRTILLTPHPDDETLGAGGLIANLRQKNIEVRIIAITDGENAYPEIKNLRQIRQNEQEQALTLLGVSKEHIMRLRLTDSSVNAMEEQLERLIFPLIKQGDHILAPWTGDYHADHEAVGRVALTIARQKKIPLSFYFFWTWHHSSINDLQPIPLEIYPLDKDTFNLKQDALSCYASQYGENHGTPILPKHVLAPAQRYFEVYYPYEH